MRWSKEKAWEWYNAHPWIRGCNYMSADCVNRVDQWQELHFEERLKSTEEDGEPLLCAIEDEDELQAVYDLIMDSLYEEEEE